MQILTIPGLEEHCEDVLHIKIGLVTVWGLKHLWVDSPKCFQVVHMDVLRHEGTCKRVFRATQVEILARGPFPIPFSLLYCTVEVRAIKVKKVIYKGKAFLLIETK